MVFYYGGIDVIPKPVRRMYPMKTREFKNLEPAQRHAAECSRQGYNVGALRVEEGYVILWSVGFLR